MESLFGLPSHPLFVHLPVVAVPAAAVVAVVLAISPPHRRRLSGWLAGLTTVGFVATFMAKESGEAFNGVLEDRIGDLADDHQQLGEQTMVLVGLFFLASVMTALLERFASIDDTALRIPATVLAAGAALLGLAASVWMIRTGHEGARIVWDGVIPAE